MIASAAPVDGRGNGWTISPFRDEVTRGIPGDLERAD
jgi:hypothetical protein